ncbi:MAG: Smr/MutS family protein [Chloroflexi bacterium]|nr:Smr/MutS family protein [Chloroflexota bacterium]
MEYLHKKGARTLVSTHYGEIKSFASHYPGVQNAAMEFDEDTLQPLFKVKIGVPGRSCAFEVARRLGMSEDLVLRARDFMKAEHLALEDLVRSVEREEEALRHERIKVEELRQKQNESLETIRAESEQARSRAASELRDLIDETKLELKEITSGYRGIALPGKKKLTRKQMKEAEDQSRTRMDEVIERLAEKTGLEIEKPETVHDLSVGDIVEVPSMKQRGTVIGIDDGDRIEVRIGQFRMWFGGSDLVKVEVSLTGNEEFDELRREKVLNTRPELNLRGQRLEEALESLAKYIDDAMLAGLNSFRVIHGKGQGVLKKAVGEYLENNPCVADYHLADTSEGSWGATVVNLK